MFSSVEAYNVKIVIIYIYFSILCLLTGRPVMQWLFAFNVKYGDLFPTIELKLHKCIKHEDIDKELQLLSNLGGHSESANLRQFFPLCSPGGSTIFGTAFPYLAMAKNHSNQSWIQMLIPITTEI